MRRRAAELNTSMFNAYYELREATIHVPSLRRAVEQAKEKGVGWDPQLFCVLDNVAQKIRAHGPCKDKTDGFRYTNSGIVFDLFGCVWYP